MLSISIPKIKFGSKQIYIASHIEIQETPVDGATNM